MRLPNTATRVLRFFTTNADGEMVAPDSLPTATLYAWQPDGTERTHANSVTIIDNGADATLDDGEHLLTCPLVGLSDGDQWEIIIEAVIDGETYYGRDSGIIDQTTAAAKSVVDSIASGATIVRADDRDGEAIAKQTTAATAAAQATAAASQTTATAIRGAMGPQAATVARSAGSNVFTIPRAGLLVVHHPTDAGKVRQWTGTGAPRWVDLATATFAECAVTLEQIGTTGIYQTTLDLPEDATYPIHLYATDATGFDDQVIAQMTWYPELATSEQVSQITAKLPTSAYLAGSDSEDGAVEVDAGVDVQEIVGGVVAAMAGQPITLVSPVAKDGTIEIVQGDDYQGDRALTWTKAWSGDAPTVTFAIMRTADYLRDGDDADPLLTVTGNASVDDGTLTVTVTLTSEQTAALPAVPSDGQYGVRWQLRLTDSDGRRLTLAMGAGTVRRAVLGGATE